MKPWADKRQRYVYVIEGEDGRPCYIGVGQGNRMHHHVRDGRNHRFGKTNPERAQYFIDCLARGFEPKPYKVAEELSAEEAYSYERILIGTYGRRDLGTGPLLNVCDGGHGPRNPSPSLRLKRSLAARAKLTPEFRKKLGDSMRGKTHSAAVRKRMSEAAKNRSEEYSAKLSAAGRRRIVSDETRKKISAHRRGTRASAKTKALLSEQRRGALHPRARLTEQMVREIRAEYRPIPGSQKAIAKKYQISRFHVSLIIRRIIWKHLP